jgi:uncharacterized protein (TIGR03083 family)
MTTTPEFEQNLRRVEERAAAFRTAVAAAASLDVSLDAKVPSCPEWRLSDLVTHLGMVHRFWAATVAAGPADAPLPEEDFLAPGELGPEALLTWSLAGTEELLSALRAAGPERGCWTWWGASGAPQTAGAVDRHQVAEALVHTYDAQLTIGRPEPLPGAEALDAVDEFLHVGCGATGPWLFEPAVVALLAAEGPCWLLELTPEGSRARSFPAGAAADPADVDSGRPAPTVTARGSASDLVLALYGRIPMEALELEGDREVLTRLRAWQPSE